MCQLKKHCQQFKNTLSVFKVVFTPSTQNEHANNKQKFQKMLDSLHRKKTFNSYLHIISLTTPLANISSQLSLQPSSPSNTNSLQTHFSTTQTSTRLAAPNESQQTRVNGAIFGLDTNSSTETKSNQFVQINFFSNLSMSDSSGMANLSTKQPQQSSVFLFFLFLNFNFLTVFVSYCFD